MSNQQTARLSNKWSIIMGDCRYRFTELKFKSKVQYAFGPLSFCIFLLHTINQHWNWIGYNCWEQPLWKVVNASGRCEILSHVQSCLLNWINRKVTLSDKYEHGIHQSSCVCFITNCNLSASVSGQFLVKVLTFMFEWQIPGPC